jgi:hypothetical protein
MRNFRTLEIPPKEFCGSAIAYVKGWFDEKPGDPPAVVLPFDDTPIMRPICEGLITAYLVDAGDAFQYVTHRHIGEAGISAEELHQKGVENLSRICAEKLEIRTHSKIFAFLMGGNFECSCILIDDIFDRILPPHIPNGYVAAAPARDLFAVCSRDSSEGIQELEELIGGVWPEGDHLVSDKLFVRDAGQWRRISAEDIAAAYRHR